MQHQELSGTPGLRLTPGRYTDRGERSRVGGGVEEKTAVLLQGANQMQELRRENEHLHRVLRQMEGDMEGLMGFKKEVERLRMERSELDAQLEDRKNEVHRLRTEGMEWSRQRETIEDTSRAQLVALQQERNSLQEQLRAEVRDHQALRNSVREDRMRQENTMEQLKQELNELAKKYQALKVSSEERETELRREVDRLHDTIAKCNSEKRELENQITRLSQDVQELEQDVDERDGNARRMQEDIEMLENSCNEQATTIETQRLEMNQLERKLEAVSFDANLVPELREQVQEIPGLRSQITRLHAQIDELTGQAKHQDEIIKALKERCEGLDQAHEELEEQIRERDDMYAGRKPVQQELEEKRDQVSSLKQEINQFQTHVSRVENDLKQTQGSLREEQNKYEELVDAVNAHLSKLTHLVQRCCQPDLPSDRDLVSSLGSELTSFDDFRTKHAGSVRNAVVSFEGHLRDLMLETWRYRDDVEEKNEQNDFLSSELHEAKRLLADSQRKCREVEQISSDRKSLLEAVGKEKTSLGQKSDQLRERLQSLNDELDVRRNFVCKTAQMLKDATGSRVQDWFDEQSWPAVAGQLEEEANQCALIISQMRKDLMFERSTREELDNQLRLSVERLDELRETSERKRLEASHDHQVELQEERLRMEELRVEQVQAKQKQLEVAELEIQRLMQENNEHDIKRRKESAKNNLLTARVTELENRERNHMAAIKLLVRGVRPLRLRVVELREQKRLLTNMLNNTEEARKEVVDLMKSMTREFRLSAGLDVAEESERRKKKTSFRGAAIAIIAANRLNRLVGKKSVMQRREVDLPSMQEFPLDPLLQCSHRRGGPSTVFVSPAEVLVRADEEIWISPEDGDAYNFVKLVEHFDASDPSAQHLGLGSCDGLRGVQGYDLDLLDSIRGAFPRAQHRRIQFAEDKARERMARQQPTLGRRSSRGAGGSASSTTVSSMAREAEAAVSRSVASAALTPAQQEMQFIREYTVTMVRRLRDAERERNQLERSDAELRAEVERLHKRLVDTEVTLGQSEEHIRELGSQMNSLENEKASLITPERYNALQDECDELNHQCLLMQEELRDLKLELTKSMNTCSELRAELQDTDDRLRQTAIERDNVQRDLNDKLSELDQTNEYLRDRAKAITRLEDELRMRNETSVELQETVNMLKREARNFKEDYHAVELRLREQDVAMSRLQREFQDLEESLNRSEDMNLRLRAELQQLEENKDEQQGISRRTADQLDREKRRNSDLETRLEDARRQIEQLERELRVLRETVAMSSREREWRGVSSNGGGGSASSAAFSAQTSARSPSAPLSGYRPGSSFSRGMEGPHGDRGLGTYERNLSPPRSVARSLQGGGDPAPVGTPGSAVRSRSPPPSRRRERTSPYVSKYRF